MGERGKGRADPGLPWTEVAMRIRGGMVFSFLAGAVLAHALGGAPGVGAALPEGFAEVIARCDPGVAHVTTVLEGGREPGSRDDAVGAGFVFDRAGLVLASRHSLEGARKVYVTLEGRGTFEAQVLGTDDVTDAAVLRIPVGDLLPLPVGDPRALRKGEWVLAAGSPFHLPRSWSAGIVSGLSRSGVGVSLKGYEDFIQTDAAANVGNSGGPLLNARGEVVGMMTAILSRTGRSEGVSLAVPIDVVLPAARAIARGEPIRRASLAVVVRETDVRGAGLPGLEITRFLPGSAAPDAGLRVGDVILEVDGVPTARVPDLQRAVWRREPGAFVSVVFARADQRFQASVRVD